MKDSIDFVKQKINELVYLIPYISCSYRFDRFDSTHYIKVLPKSLYESDEYYASIEETVINEFIEKYPYEGIVFITEEDEIDITNPDYEIKGMLFDIFTKSLIFNFADIELFDSYLPQIEANYSLQLEVSENRVWSIDKTFNMFARFVVGKERGFSNFSSSDIKAKGSEEDFYIDYQYGSAA